MTNKLISKNQNGKREHIIRPLTQAEIDAIEASKPTLEQLKSEAISQAKQTAYNRLFKTDWYVVRMFDIAEEVPQDVIEERAGIRAGCDNYIINVNACTTIEELKALGEF